MTPTTPTTSTINADKSRHVPARYPTSEELYYAAWGQEMHRGGWKLTADSLRDLIAINTVLIGGAIGLLDDKVMNSSVRPWVIGLFLGSLLVSLSAILPYGERVDLNRIDKLESLYRKTMASRVTKIWFGATLLAAGLLTAFVGILCR